MCIPKDPRKRQALLFLIGISAVLWIPFYWYGLVDNGVKDLCEQYIVISTALMAIIFAVLAIRQELRIVKSLSMPCLFRPFLFLTIYTLIF